MSLYNLWFNGQGSKTTIIAADKSEALDRFCQHWGYPCGHTQFLAERPYAPPINIETVQS